MKKVLIGLLLIIFLAGCLQATSEKALLTSNSLDFVINEANYNELLFSFSVTNYGNKEAKNVEVECKLYDESENLIVTKKENIGNVASLSIDVKELEVKDSGVSEGDFAILLCLVTDCDDCDILDKRIPEMVKEYY